MPVQNTSAIFPLLTCLYARLMPLYYMYSKAKCFSVRPGDSPALHGFSNSVVSEHTSLYRSNHCSLEPEPECFPFPRHV
ncbi:uncharacterized protein IWZ02DRAFT_462646 [Phyllosticta citriasiana]|uniref:uncharacterized protein n=1 Tax=Phyllosticta citriasiana TaxID=595635 RepID=UPI0030FD3139